MTVQLPVSLGCNATLAVWSFGELLGMEMKTHFSWSSGKSTISRGQLSEPTPPQELLKHYTLHICIETSQAMG